METYSILQHYWWFIISLLGALLVFLLFVQGGQSMLYCFGKEEKYKLMLLDSLGKKWELTFTTLVTFGGAFFASFPLFYSTSFGGAYWVWIIILLCFVLQAVSYEYQRYKGNILGTGTYRIFLIINGILGPILIGTAVGTFFNGAEFIVNKNNLTSTLMPVVSSWANPWHGLEAAGVIWNVLLGLSVFLLARIVAALYFINNIDDEHIRNRSRKIIAVESVIFLVVFLAFLVRLLLQEGYTFLDNGKIYAEEYKYLHNLIDMPAVMITMIVGILGVLFGIFGTLICSKWRKGIWFTGGGTILTVLALLLIAGWNNTSYYHSLVDIQSSLTIANSSSSMFTLKTMSYVSILIPFMAALVWMGWKALDKKNKSKGTKEGY
jgi:cytochrome bd ubiquinol oxidase subunit II